MLNKLTKTVISKSVTVLAFWLVMNLLDGQTRYKFLHCFVIQSFLFSSCCVVITDMESSKGDVDEVDKCDKNVKRSPSCPATKLKRAVEKRKMNEDSILTSVNVKVCLFILVKLQSLSAVILSYIINVVDI